MFDLESLETETGHIRGWGWGAVPQARTGTTKYCITTLHSIHMYMNQINIINLTKNNNKSLFSVRYKYLSEHQNNN